MRHQLFRLEIPSPQPAYRVSGDGEAFADLDKHLWRRRGLAGLGIRRHRYILADPQLLDGAFALGPVVPELVLPLPVPRLFVPRHLAAHVDPAAPPAIGPHGAPRRVVQLALARGAVAEAGDAQGARQDEAGIVQALPDLRVLGQPVEAPRHGRDAEEVRQRQVGQDPHQELVGQRREEVVVGCAVGAEPRPLCRGRSSRRRVGQLGGAPPAL